MRYASFKSLFLSIVTCFGLMLSTYAQTPDWESTNGPFGGASVYSIYVSADGSIFLGTYDRGVFRSDDSGQSWTRISDEELISDILITSENRILLAADNDIYFSDDEGDTWSVALEDHGGVSLAEGDGQLVVGGDDGFVHFSADNGTTWGSTEVDTSADISYVWDLAVLDDGTILAATGNALYSTTLQDTVWQETSLEEGARNLVVDGDKIYADANVSTDNGQSWSTLDAFPAEGITDLIQTADGDLYATVSPDTIYYSTDEGASWQGLSVDGFPRPDFRALGADQNGNLMVGIYESGAFKYDSDEQTWNIMGPPSTEVTDLLVLNNDKVWVGTENSGLKTYTPSTGGWSRGLSEFHWQKVGFLERWSGDSLLMGLDKQVLLSADEGQTWTARDSGLTVETFADVSPTSFTYSDEQGLFVGTESAGIFHSSDGSYWTQISDGLPESFNYNTINDLEIDSEGTVYAGTSGLYTWNASDSIWTEVTSAVEDALDDAVYSMEFHPNGDFFVGGDVLRSGTTEWEPLDVDDRYSYERVEHIGISSEGVIYVSTGRDYLFRSNDEGTTWTNITEDFPDVVVNDFAFAGDELLVATSEVGLYKRSETSTALEPVDEVRPTSIALADNYPNPFNPSTVIQFQLPRSERVTLEIFNVAGQKVATLLDEKLRSGSHTVNFDGSGLASGLYIYQLKTKNITTAKKMLLLK